VTGMISALERSQFGVPSRSDRRFTVGS
jgi:hypothetical protein